MQVVEGVAQEVELLALVELAVEVQVLLTQ
jgi:hypothetical protein